MAASHLTPEAIGQVVDAVWEQVLGLEVVSRDDSVSPEATPDLSVCVHIAGAWNGAVLFWPSDRFAAEATAILFAMPIEEVTPADIQDGIAELGNIIAGNLKSLLPGPSTLSLPTVTRGRQHEIFVRRTVLLAGLKFQSAEEPLEVLVLEGIAPPQEVAVTV